MKITLLLFAQGCEAAGRDSLPVEIAEGGGVPDLWAAVEGACPALLRLRETSRIAINHEFADEGTRIRPEDEVALIPPVSGG